MDYSTRVLGTGTSTRLRESARGIVLTIGRDHLTRVDLAGVECFNFQAARNLSAVLDAAGGVKSIADLYHTVPPLMLALPRLGAVSLAVLGAAFQLKKLGGDRPLESWMALHHDKASKRPEIVTFASIKSHSRDRIAEQRERETLKRRTAARRNKAHAIRVERTLDRAAEKNTNRNARP